MSIGCEDEADKDKTTDIETIESRIADVVSLVNADNRDGFNDICDTESEMEFLSPENWSNTLYLCGSPDFVLSDIQAEEDGTATATDQNGYSHSFVFVESGDDWYLNKWLIDGTEVFYQKLGF